MKKIIFVLLFAGCASNKVETKPNCAEWCKLPYEKQKSGPKSLPFGFVCACPM